MRERGDIPPAGRPTRSAWSLLAAALLALSLAARASGASAALPLPDKPSIAVLPFTSLRAGPDDGYLVAGITETLIADLSTVSGLFVIARDSSFHYRGLELDPSKVAGELGVRWLVQGAVLDAGETISIKVRLLDAPTDSEAWARDYDGTGDELLALSSRIRTDVLDTLRVPLTAGEQTSFTRPETGSPAAYGAYLAGLHHYRRATPEGFAAAIRSLDRAIDLDPAYARPHSVLAALYIHVWRAAWHVAFGFGYGGRSRPRELAEAHIDAALLRPTALALRWKARLLTFNDRAYERAAAVARQAIAVEPSSPDGYLALNYVLAYMSRFDAAERAIEAAMRLDPHRAPEYAARLAWIDFHKRDFEAAVSRLRAAITRDPDNYLFYVTLTAALGHLGRREEATRAIANMQATRARLGMTPVLLYHLRYWPYMHGADRELMRQGLEKAGLRD